jgi:hypothetical protein
VTDIQERTRFPGAPPGSYISEEGWLVYDDEAWTEDEWNCRRWVGRPHRATNDPKTLKRREQWREYNRRRKLAILAGEE